MDIWSKPVEEIGVSDHGGEKITRRYMFWIHFTKKYALYKYTVNEYRLVARCADKDDEDLFRKDSRQMKVADEIQERQFSNHEEAAAFIEYLEQNELGLKWRDALAST